jgi:hypothetical protein
LRVYVIGRNYQGTQIDMADAARRFTAWLADDANPVLAEVIHAWMWQPPDAGGLGALAESTEDVAALRAEITALLQPTQTSGPDARGTR